MRMIGHLGNEAHARLFSDYLYAQGVENEVEPDRDGSWAVWVHAEEELDHATRQLQISCGSRAMRNISTRRIWPRTGARSSGKLEEAAQKRHFDRDKLMPKRIYGIAIVTFGLIVLSVVLSLLFWTDLNLNWLRISEFDVRRGGPARIQHGLPEVRSGQVWRIFTPILLHGGFCICSSTCFGSKISAPCTKRPRHAPLPHLRPGHRGLSNLGQFIISGPNFVGMSGVVYALLGYIWIRGRLDPQSGFFVDQSTMLFMTIWFFACLSASSPMWRTPSIPSGSWAGSCGVTSPLPASQSLSRHSWIGPRSERRLPSHPRFAPGLREGQPKS
jgi:GlpG protein